MNIAKYFLLSLLIFGTSNLFAQNEEGDDYDPANFIENQTTTKVNNAENQDIEKASKLSYNIELGSSISTSSTFGTSVDFFTAPQINYNFTPRLQFATGVLLINSSNPAYTNETGSSRGVSNFTRSYLFNKINYQATEKLRISGEILYGMNKNPYGVDLGSKKSEYVMNFNAEYKINENFRIGLQLSGHNLNSPYGYNSYTNPFRPMNSFYSSPFSAF
ncbi:MAG: hypothetical protein ABFS35_15615 [Bacteroidota bacterium]